MPPPRLIQDLRKQSRIITDRLTRLAGAAPPRPEYWHEVGNLGEPAYQNGFTDYTTFGATPLAFRKDQAGFVHLRGHVDIPSALSTYQYWTIFTLPVGYRPPRRMRLLYNKNAQSFEYIGGLFIYADGQVGVVANGPGWITLSGNIFAPF